MKLIYRIFLVLVSICIGALFIYSAYTKLNPIQSFEYTLVEYAHFPWIVAALSARFFIGLEAALGSLLVLHLYGKGKWVLKTALGLIVLLSAYLVYLWLIFGNNVNCGCFGDAIWMSPSSSLLKNIILLLLLILLHRYHNGLQKKWVQITSISLLVVVTSLPFIIYALPDQEPTWLKKSKFQLDMSAIYTPALSSTPPSVDLRKGKHIIAFLSFSCPHCRMAAHKMHIMKEMNPAIPFYFVMAGREEYIKSFWKETAAESIPHTRLDADAFTGLVGYSWPVIYWVNNGWVEAETNYIIMSQGEIEKWLAKP